MKHKHYLKAAKLIDGGQQSFCCAALNHVGANIVYFRDIFEPNHLEHFKFNGANFNTYNWFGLNNSPENQLARQLALLLCYEMQLPIGNDPGFRNV